MGKMNLQRRIVETADSTARRLARLGDGVGGNEADHDARALNVFRRFAIPAA